MNRELWANRELSNRFPADSLRSDTQRITQDWILQSRLSGDELLLEGLLRRGFLAFRDKEGLWLGTGSHPEDLEVLTQVIGLKVEPLSGHKYRAARVSLRSTKVEAIDVTIRIVLIPQNSGFMSEVKFRKTFGDTWDSYRNMVWGTRLPTCPTSYTNRDLGYDALDMGVALLIKAFPLARVATSWGSCDGHGCSEARISLASAWDVIWAKSVFNVLGIITPNSRWKWEHGVRVEPLNGYDDFGVLNMLNDIQHFARRLLDHRTIERVGLARVRTLKAFGETPLDGERFAQEAQYQLGTEFCSGVEPSAHLN